MCHIHKSTSRNHPWWTWQHILLFSSPSLKFCCCLILFSNPVTVGANMTLHPATSKSYLYIIDFFWAKLDPWCNLQDLPPPVLAWLQHTATLLVKTLKIYYKCNTNNHRLFTFNDQSICNNKSNCLERSISLNRLLIFIINKSWCTRTKIIMKSIDSFINE